MLIFLSCKNEINKQEILELVSHKINKSCPMKIDDLTTLDSTNINLIKSDLILNYFYTLDISKSDINVKDFYFEEYDRLSYEYKTNAGLKTFREFDIPLEYTYFDMHQKQIISILVHNNSKSISF